MDDDVDFVRVAGVSFYQEALADCRLGEPVRLVHEPDNPHDEMALRIDTLRGETIGYVPRNSWVRAVIHERGRGIAAVIDSIGLSRSCILGARLSAAICDDEVAIASHFPDRPAPEPPSGGFRYWVRSPVDAGQRVAKRR